MTMHRRHWILGAASLSAAGWLTACSTSNASRSATSAGFVARQVGEARVIAVSDGVGKRALDAGFVKNAPLEQVQAALQAAGLPTTHIDVPYTCFVIEHQGKRYLLDTGFGDNGPAGTGLLHTHMRAAGIDPSTIDAVIISHMHGDHINGLRRKDGSLIYPKALVYVPQPEMAFWMDDARMHAAPEGARAGFMAVRRVFNNYPGNQLKLFVPGSSILPGLDTIASFGHSPGHSAIAVQSGKERFVYIGDVAHYPALFVRHPDWQVQFDMHPEQARATRHHLLTRLAQEQSWVGGYHFPLPSIGHIQKTSTGFDWLPGR
ncbi:MBL fold metallo-hydrolase [Comamonas sp. NoAH]|uniref:MBL fold metallo-hydrolase n=1 Tax=Comamonas halotolerans TaxID=3041496 RepID=UPI0024E0C468|nr:MBL fold metallo-hydrolase [Comamonas sp. NoAH]